ncbi:nitroreductase family protein [Mycoplasma sp. E35C]|uniref:nitroreductase family protein n=1 Tax=Mycoplasma sp. E35C TaxID=2801918 RepID=UPI001CA43D18|nr:nitroreductase family protein [Mycoplasma sp. E35C]QZX49100.1 nitroreductase family protein [Mycoplasma sp. E35C]
MIEKLLDRRSERKYSDKPIEQEKIQKLFEVINNSPTSRNSQDFSVIVVEDKELREKITQNKAGQKLTQQSHIIEAPLFLLFCADWNRMEHMAKLNDAKIVTDTHNNLITSAGDAFIAATFTHAAALSMGLGCCYIGFVRHHMKEIQEHLNLDGKIIPIIGLTVGYIDTQLEKKPKVNHIYQGKYDLKQLKAEIEKYDTDMLAYYDSRSVNKKHNKWSETILTAYAADDESINDYINEVFYNKK